MGCVSVLVALILSLAGCNIESTNVETTVDPFIPPPRLQPDQGTPDMEVVCQPRDEICNQLDDDCDGETDEGVTLNELALGADCETGLGICSTVGLVSCVDKQIAEMSGGVLRVGEAYCEPLASSAEMLVERESGVECDAIDNDCDGFIDEHFSSALDECGDGACSEVAFSACIEGEVTSQCRDGEPNGADDNCDGVDDDCDGSVDESYLVIELPCGVGACLNRGPVSCQNSSNLHVCDVMPSTGSDDDCDGIDDDCDGNIDEDFATEEVSCGVGACSMMGQRVCEQGAITTLCTPGAPSDNDLCDGIDNDCDQIIDEGHVLDTVLCGEGVCLAAGILICTNGMVTEACTPITPATEVDVCNGVDEDCDGITDEDHTITTTDCGLGVCAGQGELLCVGGALTDTCQVTAPDETDLDSDCDNIDSDCDGQADEGFVELGVLCGEGACSADGVEFCQEGVVVNNCVIGEPALNDTTCDNRDDDCDGVTDENYFARAVICGQGECTRQGISSCENGDEVNGCEPGEPLNSDQNCNGLDEDCDGRVDEGYVVTGVTCGLGVCERGGVLTCVDGQELDTCVAGDEVSADDQCDQIDNDCDGFVDESYAPEEVTCGVGACQRTGNLICSSQGAVNTCQPLDTPENEFDRTCNGVDEDCDGVVDEGYQSTELSCGVGECRRNGQTVCIDGQVNSQCVVGSPQPLDSTCNLRDEDCDGLFDEDYLPAMVICPPEACNEMGQELCTQNGIINNCVFGAPNDETCNGVDEDCDGSFDEDYTPPMVMTSCGQGICAVTTGSLACEDGDVVDTCVPLDIATNDDNCNNLDDDCDGVSDEGYEAIETCGVGQCENTVSLSCTNGVTSQCEPLAPPSPFDICNSRQDDNCDGEINPAYNSLGAPCQVMVGECSLIGQWVCNPELNGLLCKPPKFSPRSEICGDRIDNDCDGYVDERC